MTRKKALEKMTLEELEAEREALALQRTEVRLQQKAVEEAIEFQQALGGMPEGLRDRIRLEGGMKAAGGQA
jgi:outer membrane protein TolC